MVYANVTFVRMNLVSKVLLEINTILAFMPELQLVQDVN